MITHRFFFTHYQQCSVFFWPILFFELWRVDRWQDQTGRKAFVRVDRYGRAWVPYWEGMSRQWHVTGVYTKVYTPSDVTDLCPGVLENTLSTADPCVGRGLWTVISSCLSGAFRPWIPACAGIDGNGVFLEPG